MNPSFFTPVFMNEKEFEEGYKQSIYYTDKNFRDEFYKHQTAMQHISSCAKSYILNNWEKVKDWKDLTVTIVDSRDGTETRYYNFVEKESKTESKAVSKYIELLRESHNPVSSFEEVILDPTDGDFSVKINGKDHYWIDDDSVIAIADYIERYEKETSDTPTQG